MADPNDPTQTTPKIGNSMPTILTPGMAMANALNGGSTASSSSTNSSSDSTYQSRNVHGNPVVLPGYKTSTPPLNRTRSSQQAYDDQDSMMDSKSALSQILNGIADMQREVSCWRSHSCLTSGDSRFFSHKDVSTTHSNGLDGGS
jgi:tRNA U34 5-carboxymethylaminomethyl modifying enzyme MnmG/GidA